MTVQAIETFYAGYKFRSRLEARWAVFFDSLNIEWQYEPEGFERSEFDDDNNLQIVDRYLPDFYLPKTETWVEVKGDSGALVKDWITWDLRIDFGGILPGVCDSYQTGRGLLVLTDIPRIKYQTVVHPLFQHYKGTIKSYAMFTEDGIKYVSASGLPGFFFDETIAPCEDDWSAQPVNIRGTNMDCRKIGKAYDNARQARFEHGEVPCTTI